MILEKHKKTPLVSPQPAFYMTGCARSTHWLHPPTWIGFCLFIALKFNYRFLLSVFCFRFYMTDFARSTIWLHSPTWIDFSLFFPAWGIRPLFNRASFLRRILLLEGGGEAKLPPPLQPPTHLTSSSTGCKSMKTKRLGMKAIRATHMQARTIIT